MATFDKSAVDVAELSRAEVDRVVAALGLGAPVECKKLTNGGCAANYRVTLAGGGEVVVKACVGDDATELATSQLDVLKQVALHGGAAPAAKSLNVVACRTTTGAQAAAIAMELLPGDACNILIRDGALAEVAAFEALGGAMAKVHGVPPPPDLYDVGEGDYVERYVRCAAPLEAHPEVWDETEPTGFVRWACYNDELQLLRKSRAALVDAALPRGLLHGDAYTDNVMHDAASGKTALVDWEDAAVGPLAFDVATAAVGGGFAVPDDDAADDVFPQPAAPKLDVIAALLRSYAAGRGAFTRAEADAFVALMLANAVACALYRFHAFHVTDPGAPRAAKRSYREMHAITMALADPKVAAELTALAAGVVTES